MSDDDKTVLDGPAIEDEQLADWRPLLRVLTARFETGDFATGLKLVQQVGEAAEAANHHPDVELTYPTVTIRLTSHDVGGITRRDIDLARAISGFAAELGAAAAPAGTARLELALDTHDIEQIRPFWAAVLNAETSGEPDELIDPTGQVPVLWFQETEDVTGPVSQRWHLDLRIPPEEVQDRLAAALAAGGTLDSDAYAPQFWVLADPQGNKVCLTTWQGRSHA